MHALDETEGYYEDPAMLKNINKTVKRRFTTAFYNILHEHAVSKK